MTTQELNALAPCPFCGGSDVVCCDQGDDDFAVTCKSCGASSKFDDVKSEAVRAWNTRTAATSPASVKAMREKTGWLIEKDDPPVYCIVNPKDYDEQWTSDASKALRFARREDAQAYSDHIGWTSPPVRIAEHMWVDGNARAAMQASVETATPAQEVVGYVCTGCGRLTKDPIEDMKAILKAGAISCCPERRMQALSRDWKTIEEQIAEAQGNRLLELFRDYLCINMQPGNDLAPLYVARIDELLSQPAPPSGTEALDAKRYRWLRDPKTDVALVLDKRVGESIRGLNDEFKGYDYEYRAGDELDAAIDAAMTDAAAQQGPTRTLIPVLVPDPNSASGERVEWKEAPAQQAVDVEAVKLFEVIEQECWDVRCISIPTGRWRCRCRLGDHRTPYGKAERARCWSRIDTDGSLERGDQRRP